jgi:hypothetical protein
MVNERQNVVNKKRTTRDARRYGVRCTVAALALAILICCPRLARSQDVVSDAVAWFPPGTVALEYSDASALRGLPDYQTLRQHFLGRNLQALEQSLSALGITEGDINQLVLGMQAENGNMFEFEGVAAGTFDPQTVAQHATSSGLAATKVGSSTAYCLASKSAQTCVAILQGSLGVFGPLPVLSAMLKARAEAGTGQGGSSPLAQLVQNGRADAPIWGVVLGSAVSKWFQSWMPASNNLQMNWSTAFRGVRSLAFQVRAGDNVHLEVKLMCATNQDASSLSQLMQGLKLVQKMSWQNSHPSQPNPFENLDVEAADNQVTFNLTATYAAIENPGTLGRPH